MPLKIVKIVTYLAIRVVKELLQVTWRKVRNTNVPHLTRLHQLLHLAPSITEIPILIVLLSIFRRRRARPMDQVQIHVVGAELLEALGQRLGHTLVPRVVELGGQPDLVARDPRCLDAIADFPLVAVTLGGVDVAVAGA